MVDDKFPSPSYKKYLMNELFRKSLKRSHGQYMIEAHKAHCVMLTEQGIINSETSGRILKSLKSVEAKIKTLTLDDFNGDVEDLYFVIEQNMIKDIGIEDAGALHTGRSRNDLGHTIFRMAFRDQLLIILEDLAQLAENLYTKGLETRESIITAWTHCQPAQPSTYGHYTGAVLEVLLRELERLLHNYNYVDCSPYGAAAITTTGFPINRDRTSDLLGFIEPVLNSYGAIGSTDYILNTLGIIKSLCIHLGKYAVDQLDWARMEINQIDVPDSWVQKSSIMPQKRNAVVFEHLRARYSTISSLCDIPSNSMKNTPFGDIDDIETEYHENIHKLFDLMKITVPMMADVVKVISVNSENAKNMIDRFCLLSTELADSMVRTEGISFRQAHEIAAAASKYCVDKKIPLSKIPESFIAEQFSRIIGRNMKGKTDDLKAYLSAEHFISIRTVKGGTAASALEQAYETYRKRLDSIQDNINTHRKRHNDSNQKLNQLL